MKRIVPGPFEQSVQALMQKVGYTFHCTADGRPCYHRKINDPAFPRFHAYVIRKGEGIEVDLHFDRQDPINHKGNHQEAWAYTGARVSTEMARIVDELTGKTKRAQVPGAENIEPRPPKPNPRKGYFDILFK